MSETYQALVIEKNEDRSFARNIKELSLNALPDEDVLIRTHYSTINYKDILYYNFGCHILTGSHSLIILLKSAYVRFIVLDISLLTF